MSFYVKSSITGTFSFTIYRDEPGTDRIVNKTYTINSANTWERKTITIAGDTDRAVNNTNTSDWWNVWHLAVGSDYDGSVRSVWQNYVTTNWAGGHAQDGGVTTAGATWQITGGLLEVGSTATNFEHRCFGEELSLCQRYYFLLAKDDGAQQQPIFNAQAYNSSTCYGNVYFPCTMRTDPTIDATTGTNYYITYGNNTSTYSSALVLEKIGQTNTELETTGGSFSQGNAYFTRTATGAGGKIAFTAEL